MNDAQKRRIKLLEETRGMYRDRNTPAIHPRYGAVYQNLYGTDGETVPSTFGIRLFLCFMLFAAFITLDNNKLQYKNVNSTRIVQEITTDMDVKEVWQNL